MFYYDYDQLNFAHHKLDSKKANYLLRFSFLEYSLIFNFEKRESSRAKRELASFFENHADLIKEASHEELHRSLINVVSDFTMTGLANHFNATNFVQLRETYFDWLTPEKPENPEDFQKTLELICKDFYNLQTPEDEITATDTVPKQVYQITYYVNMHLYDKMQPIRIADYLNLSYQYVSRLFTHTMGLSIQSYIDKQRVDESKKLLLHTDLPLSEIARMLNYYDSSNYIKHFKKFSETTPKQYRLQNKRECFRLKQEALEKANQQY
ncbi:Transcriptional regulator, AraC family [Pediococcus damnosus]|uniref:helix-turn-helix transcriptional regulator n=1 Tax=Pediococcus damnosus TaxID=51663 RepID=UPI00078D2DFA|nr:AraC family transcriptional regulator [Pediococcus damnosus]AMV69451.1 Transcriptional regulator, AraC family [Pediococcus damnosus]